MKALIVLIVAIFVCAIILGFIALMNWSDANYVSPHDRCRAAGGQWSDAVNDRYDTCTYPPGH